MGKALVENMARWHEQGVLHGNLSVSSVGLAPDGSVLVSDFAPLAVHSSAGVDPATLTATQVYTAIGVQHGKEATLSTELESIFYVLAALSSVDGVLHWQTSPPGSTDAKVAAMMNNVTFDTKVSMQACLHPL